MDLGFIFLAIAVIGLVIFIVAQPFFERSRPVASSNVEAEQLGAERDAILAAVRDLDFDHVTGKITDDDYVAQRADLMARGADILKRLDTTGVVDDSQVIEQAIAARRHSPARAATPEAAVLRCPDCGTPYKAGDRFCSGCGRSLTLTCGQCGSSVTANDRFCGKCGAPVAVEARS
jgi:hypothetical protein